MSDMPIEAINWKVRVSSPYTNFSTNLTGDIDEVTNEAILLAQEEAAFYEAKKGFPQASAEEIEEALTHVRHHTQQDHELVDARQAFDGIFFTVNIDMGHYGILICGVKIDN